MKFVKRVDDWWDRTAPTRRLDRNAGNMCMLIGLALTSFSVILIGPSPSSAIRDMTDHLQIAMCVCIFSGCLIKLFGAVAHSRFFFRHMRVKTCYQIAVGGAPFAASGLFVYGWFLLENTPSWTSALGAVLTPMLGAGILIQSVFYLLEARRIGRNERLMIREAKAVIREQRLDS
jgi:multisubunit Na+/H+ antiporter MnhG subunit